MEKNTLGDLRETLLRKLKGGNRRYPHLNATLGRSVSKADLSDLNEIKKGLAGEFLNKLLNEVSFNFTIPLKDIDKEILKYANKKDLDERDKDKVLHKLKILASIKKKFGFLEAHQKEEISEFGTQSFAFGYPLLAKQEKAEKEDLICSPLFIWYLDIRRDYQTNSIVISRNEDNPIVFNEMLDFYLESNLNLDFSKTTQSFNEEIFDDGIMDKDELNSCVDKITQKISSSLKFQLDTLNPVKTPNNKKEVAQLLTKNNYPEMIINSGVFGVFRAGKQSIIDDLKNLINLEQPGPVEEEVIEANEIPFVVIETDPTQNNVIEKTNESNNLIIQGPPGTGKSQTLTALITNALTNKHRTLVVCEKRTAMEIIASNLAECGLEQYVALIENVNKDRSGIIDKARAINESKNEANYMVTEELNSSVKTYGDAALLVARHHDSISTTETKGLGQNKNILGLYLKEVKDIDLESYKLIKKELSTIPFSFNKEEFNSVSEDFNSIRSQYVKFEGLQNLPKDQVIRNNDFASDRRDLAEYITDITGRIEKLKSQVDDYRERLTEQFIQRSKDQHKLATTTTKNAQKTLEVSADNFNWTNLLKDIKEINFSGSKELAQDLIKKIIKNEEQINMFEEALETKYSEVNLRITEIKNLSDIVSENIKLLKNLGVDSFQVEITDNIKAIFGSRQKNIKIYRHNIDSSIKKVNHILRDYNYIFKIDDIAISKNLVKDIKNLRENLPTKNKIIDFFVDQKTKSIISIKNSEDLSSKDYLNSKRAEQFDEYQKLKIYLWKYYRELIKSQLTPYLAEELNFNPSEKYEEGLATQHLNKIIDGVIDEKSLNVKANEIVDNLKTTNTQGVGDIKKKIEAIVTSEPYLKVFVGQRKDLIGKKSLSELQDFLGNYLDSLLKLKLEMEKNFFTYHSWCMIFKNLESTTKKIIEFFEVLKIPQDQWNKFFKGVYFELAFIESCTADNLKNDIPIEQMLLGDTRIKKLLVDNINAVWGSERLVRIGSFESGILKFNSLYNKRGGRGQRRNSLRRIIDKDFLLFTSLFPVLICNPSSAASLLKLEKNLFDTVLFDEASQLRLEDTYTSLYRGRRKIISGDRHQMPPSNYFQAVGGDEDTDYDDDESIQGAAIVNSESLLDYGQVNNYSAEMLRVHYRSSHQDLINFSNYAFYGNKLMPLPSLADYKPIDFYQIGGKYSDRTNLQEVKFIIQWLTDYINDGSLEKGIGIVTLNLPQSELIKEKISEKRTEDSVFNAGISKLEELGFFVKNLENIQGDERDIMVLSTTFGIDKDGKFIQRFGPLNLKNGYRLLNVLVTRAKDRFVVVCSIPDRYINKYQDELIGIGNDKRAIFYAYLAYARAVSNENHDEKERILNLLAEKSGEVISSSNDVNGNTESPFEEEVLAKLETVIDKDRIRLQFEVGSEKFRIDIVIMDKTKTYPILAVECDGYTYHSTPDAYLYDLYRQKILEKKGFEFYRIWSTNWFHDTDNEAQKLIKKIQELDDT